MEKREIIKEKLNNLGVKILSESNSIIKFIDDTRTIQGDFYLFQDNEDIAYHLKMYANNVYRNILISSRMPYEKLEIAFSEISNILDMNRQLYKNYTRYLASLPHVDSRDDAPDLFEEFINHFSQFGDEINNGVSVYRYLSDMVIRLDNKLNLTVTLDTEWESKLLVFSKVINKNNYEEVFAEVDELITKFEENVLTPDRYLELLKGNLDK